MQARLTTSLIALAMCFEKFCFAEQNSLKSLVQEMYANVIENPAFDEKIIERYFSKEYIEVIDGDILHYNDFLGHIQSIKEREASAKVTFEQLVEEGNKICSIHWIDVVKKDQTELGIQVIAVFEVEDGKIIACKELTKFYPKGS